MLSEARIPQISETGSVAPASDPGPDSGERIRAPRICLGCRALLLEDESCACDAEAVAPASPSGWSALSTAVWGDEAPRSERRERVAASIRLADDSAVRPERVFAVRIAVVIALTVGALAAVTGRWAASWLIGGISWACLSTLVVREVVRRSRLAAAQAPVGKLLHVMTATRKAARGAPPIAVAHQRIARGVGWPEVPSKGLHVTVQRRDRSQLIAPLSGQRCMAWAVWVRGPGGVLFRDARCEDMLLVTDDGEHIEVDAGRLDVRAAEAFTSRFPMSVADEFLTRSRLHPPPSLGDDDPASATHPFAGDTGYELVLREGTELWLANEVVTESAADAPMTYRDGVGTRRVPVGLPRVTLCESLG